jgi:hypothetical protein
LCLCNGFVCVLNVYVFVTFVVVLSFSLQEVRHEFLFFLLNSNVVEFIFLMSNCLEHNARSFDQTIKVIQSQTKFNTSKILEKYKIFPKR